MRAFATLQQQVIGILSATILVASMSACGGVPKEVLEEAATTSEEFLIGPEDLLEVVVWRNQDLTREVVVRPDGTISLPLIGSLKASGLTSDQLAERIAERLQQYKESPKVSVHVKQVNSYAIYVLGEVPNPGRFQPKSYCTVLHAIAIAGGFTEFASRNDMQVIRQRANGDGTPREVHIPVSYDDLLAGEGEPGNFILKSGDIVVVP